MKVLRSNQLTCNNTGKHDEKYSYETLSVMHVCCRCTFVAAAIAILAMTCISEVTSSSCNRFDRYHRFACPSGKPICSVSGYHSNSKEDRIYCYNCHTESGSTSATSCYETGYVNSFDGRVRVRCDPDYYISGVRSYHSNSKEDRRFAFKCCKISGLCTKNCHKDGPVNNYDGRMDYHLHAGEVIVGAESVHDNRRE